MFYIIEKKEQLDKLHVPKEAFIHIIPVNSFYHPLKQEISLIYFRPLQSSKGFIFCVNHSESLSLKISDITHYLSEVTVLYVNNKKAFNHVLSCVNFTVDVSLLNTIYNYKDIDFFQYETDIEILYQRRSPEFNRIIPISKHYEKMELYFKDIEYIISKYDENDPKFKFYNEILTDNFTNIEKNGLKLNKNEYVNYFDLPHPEYSIDKGKIYTQYNLYTLTTRPSNSFNGVNFSALNKTTGIRKTIIPQNDEFIEIDFHAYHPVILSKIVKYNFDYSKNIYEQLSRIMNIDDINNVKQLVFQQLYGGIKKEYKHLPFFKEVNDYVESIWIKFYKEGVCFPTYGKPFNQYNVESPTPYKLLSYIIQNAETILNGLMISNILKLLENKKSKIVLYTYDSILIDYHKNDEILSSILDCLWFKVSSKKGLDYGIMEKI